MLDTVSVTEHNFSAYQSMLLLRQIHRTRKALADDACFVIGARCDGEPVGIAVVSYGMLVRLWVQPEYRDRGIGTLLMEAVVGHADRLGLRHLYISYSLESEWSAKLAHLTKRCGFSVRTRSHVITIRVDGPSLQRHSKLLRRLVARREEQVFASYTSQPYRQMPDAVRTLLSEGRGIWYPLDVDPLQHPGEIDQDRSRFYYRGDEIAGWLIICRKGRNAVFYRNFFVRQECRGAGLFLRMILEGIEWIGDVPEINRAVFRTLEENINMLSIMRKTLKVYQYTEGVIVEKEKVFTHT